MVFNEPHAQRSEIFAEFTLSISLKLPNLVLKLFFRNVKLIQLLVWCLVDEFSNFVYTQNQLLFNLYYLNFFCIVLHANCISLSKS